MVSPLPGRLSLVVRRAGAATAALAVAAASIPASARAKPPARPARDGHRPAPLVKRRGSQKIAAAPLRIELAPGPVLGFGRQVVRLGVLPLADAPRLDVKITALRGLAVARGNPASTVVARSGQPVTEDLVLAVVGPGEQKLVVTAMMRYPDGQQHGGAAVWVFNPQPHRMTDLHPGSRISVDEEGNKTLEIPAK